MSSSDGMTFDHETEEFDPTFKGGRQERRWIKDSLEEFWQDHLISDVLYKVAGGKEATVYCCQGHPNAGLGLVAAKVLRPRKFRAMRNYSLYLEGRIALNLEGKFVPDGRSARALRKMTRFGRMLETASWCRHEFRALEELSEAGADVPRPIALGHNTFLMEYVGDEEYAAPTLHSVSLEPDEARGLFDRLVRNIEILLSTFRIHGDLSAYNVLYWQGDVRIIDFPQAIDALRHPQAFTLFARDIDRLCRYFTRQGVETDPIGLARDLWKDWIG